MDLWLIGAASVPEATHELEKLEPAEQRKVLLIGELGTLDVRQPAKPGTFAGLLERFEPFGS